MRSWTDSQMEGEAFCSSSSACRPIAEAASKAIRNRKSRIDRQRLVLNMARRQMKKRRRIGSYPATPFSL